MKVKFNKFERVAGLFVCSAIVGAVVLGITVAVKRGWFAPKISFITTFESAEGVHPGTAVQMSGLRAGSVEEVELQNDNTIRVTFTVLEKFHEKIRQDSTAQLIRPFIIGDRVLEVTLGSQYLPMVAEKTFIPAQETTDIMSLLSGKKLGPYLDTMNTLLGNLKVVADAFLDKSRSESIVKAFDNIEPLIRNLNTMSVEVIKLSKQASRNENLGKVLGNLSYTTKEINKIIPELKAKAPEMTDQLISLIDNLSQLTSQFKVFIPAIAEVAPDLPRTSRRAVEALDEAVVLLKAMQKSFFIRSSAREVREEEAKRELERQPASENEE